MIKVGVVGATRYAAVQSLHLPVQHSEMELPAITSRGQANMVVHSEHEDRVRRE